MRGGPNGSPHMHAGGQGGPQEKESVAVEDVGFTAQSQRAMKQAGRMCMGMSIPGTGHTAYVFDILTSNGERWKVTRRYSDFLDLNQKLIQVCLCTALWVACIASAVSFRQRDIRLVSSQSPPNCRGGSPCPPYLSLALPYQMFGKPTRPFPPLPKKIMIGNQVCSTGMLACVYACAHVFAYTIIIHRHDARCPVQ